MNTNTNLLVSVCVVIRNNQSTIASFVTHLREIVASQYPFYEIILVDNSSSDATANLVKEMQTTLAGVRLIRLSRLYSFEIALTAALDNSIGDYVVLLDFYDDPPELIPPLIEKARAGYDIVVVKSKKSDAYSVIDRMGASILYAFASRILGHHFQLNDTHCRVFTRQVVNSLTQIRNKRRYLRAYNFLLGFQQASIDYEDYLPPRSRKHVNRLEKTGALIDLVISNSTAPLRFASLIGLAASFLNLIYFTYIIIVTLIRQGHLAEGWLTTSVTNTTMFFLIFVILTILAEYIGVILHETKDEPLYFVEYETSSRVSTYHQLQADEKLNVIQEDHTP